MCKVRVLGPESVCTVAKYNPRDAHWSRHLGGADPARGPIDADESVDLAVIACCTYV